MNSEERFKKSLEELLQSKEFSFDEDNWNKASAMISASKKAKGRIVPFIVGGLLLLVSGLGGFYLLNEPAKTLTEKIRSQPETMSKHVAENLSETAVLSSPVHVTTEKTMHQVPQPSTKPLETTESSRPEQPLLVLPATDAAVQNDQGRMEVQIVRLQTPDTRVQSNTVKTEAAPSKENSPVSPDRVQSPENSPVSINAQNNEPVAVVAPMDASIVPSPANNGEHLASDTPPALTGGGHSVRSSVKEVDKAESISQVKVPEVAPDKLPEQEQKTEIHDPVAPTATALVSNNAKQAKDTILSLNDLGEISDPKIVPILFSFEAGASYLAGWKNPAGRDANGFNLVVGFNYFNNFTTKIAVSLGIHYTNVSNLSYSSHTTRIKQLNFGEESQVSVYTPTKVHYLVAPLRFNYTVNAANSLGIGCNVGYLLTVDTEIDSFTEKQNVTLNHTLSKTKGYTEGFSTFDTQAAVFYKRRLYPNLSVNAEIFFGLTDIKKNTFFGANTFERNSGIKLTLVYNILKNN